MVEIELLNDSQSVAGPLKVNELDKLPELLANLNFGPQTTLRIRGLPGFFERANFISLVLKSKKHLEKTLNSTIVVFNPWSLNSSVNSHPQIYVAEDYMDLKIFGRDLGPMMTTNAVWRLTNMAQWCLENQIKLKPSQPVTKMTFNAISINIERDAIEGRRERL